MTVWGAEMIGALTFLAGGYAFAVLLAFIGHRHNRSFDARRGA